LNQSLFLLCYSLASGAESFFKASNEPSAFFVWMTLTTELSNNTEAGDYVPADGRLLEAGSLKVDEGMLTGESTPAEKVL
jgi:high-affinity K+ transport system ATPase subunit B